jgi:hypothetical protein
MSDSTVSSTPKQRTITLTGRPPVKIREDQWPVIARADWHDGGEHPSRANRSAFLRVRQHADGRALVYGGTSTNWQGERDLKAGALLTPSADIPAAIRRVAESLGHDGQHSALVQDCIADLPAEEI